MTRIEKDHPLRYELANELHARPFEALSPPLRVTHLALLSGEGTAGKDRDHLEALCRRFGVNPPQAGANHFSGDFGKFRLKWERHTEFTTYTVFVSSGGPKGDAFGFDRPASGEVPKEWLDGLLGERLVAVNLTMLPRSAKEPAAEELSTVFVEESLSGSIVSGGAAMVWTDFRIHSDGFGRILIKDREMSGRKAGRIVQRVLEIETYRYLALLALPMARATGSNLKAVDESLVGLLANINSSEVGIDDGTLLKELTDLSADLETLIATATYRFGAAKAYHALVRSRITELREEVLGGYQTLGEFLDRRLAPAMRTCESVSDRLADLSRRATRAANLLRTRVDYALEAQNQRLLKSMERRVGLQLRLQETVEGLSVAAITYYTVGLVYYASKAVEEAGVPVHPALVAGLAIPVVAVVIAMLVRRARRAIRGEEDERD